MRFRVNLRTRVGQRPTTSLKCSPSPKYKERRGLSPLIYPECVWNSSSSIFELPQRHCFSTSLHQHASVMVKVPPMADSVTEGTLATFNKQVGEDIQADEELANIETDKIDVPVNAPQAGTITKFLTAEGDTVSVGQDVAVLETELQEEKSESLNAGFDRRKEQQKSAPSTASDASVEFSSSTLSSGDHEQALNRGERVVKLSRMRMAIAKNLKQAQNTCASTTTYQDIDMTNLLKWREQHRDRVSEIHGVRLGYMGAFTKATTLAAAEVPEITATINLEKQTVTYRDFTNVSIAVSTPKGLVTPVVRNTQNFSVVELERQIAALATKSRESKLVMEDLEGGHFSISNPGIFGSFYGTPLIPLGQAATFNLSSIRDRVVPVDGKIEIRPQMIVSLTYDHRLIDGLEALKFLNLVKKYIQDPELLPLE